MDTNNDLNQQLIIIYSGALALSMLMVALMAFVLH